jgi:cation diffusion facilitator family transporter
MRPQVIIVGTIVLNAILFGANLYVAVPSGSKAVLSQAIYSVTDLVGALLLLWGTYASHRLPTHEHPFGFGKERFFWAFVASLVTFSVAGLLVLLTGIQQIATPGPITEVNSALVVVGLSIIGSLGGIYITLRELRVSQETVATLMESSHLGLKAIFYQDLVSIGGSIVAFGGILVVAWFHANVADGIAAAIVGGMLIATGFVLTAESRELLIGKSIPPRVAREILAFIERDASVQKVRGLQSMMLGPDDVLIALRINFPDGMTTDQIEAAIDRISLGLRQAYPQLRHIVIEPES